MKAPTGIIIPRFNCQNTRSLTALKSLIKGDIQKYNHNSWKSNFFLGGPSMCQGVTTLSYLVTLLVGIASLENYLNLLNPFWPEKPIWICSNILGPTPRLAASVSAVGGEAGGGELLSEGVLDISLCQEPELDMWTLYSPSSWNRSNESMWLCFSSSYRVTDKKAGLHLLQYVTVQSALAHISFIGRNNSY